VKKTLLFVALVLLITGGVVSAQSASPTTEERKVITRVAPVYPELGKKMHLQGVVKIEAIVRPNGTVKSTRVLGGNPVLVDAATEAVNKWKFEAAQSETTEVLQLTFTPQ
jgi:TonB family protein